MTKRFTVRDMWIKDNCIGKLLNIYFNTITDANLCCDLLNHIEKEKRDNGKLASKLLKENNELKQTISKIDFAIIRKYDHSLENLLDEVYSSEYNIWIEKQLSRGKVMRE